VRSPGPLRRCLLALAAAAACGAAPGADPPVARRVVSLNPSLTSILVAIGASGALAGIEEYAARIHPELAHLPRVGGLFNPSLEAVVALEPDLVVLVPSAQQRDFARRLGELGVEVLSLPNLTVEEVLRSIEVRGARVGRAEEAAARVGAIRGAFQEQRRASAGLPGPRALVVLQRDPLFVVGRGSFVDEMLAAAGARNAAAGFGDPYPRVSVEWVIGAAPGVLIDVSDDPQDGPSYWSRWPSIPAVAAGRVFSLDGERLTYPGPYLDRSLDLLARTLRDGGPAPSPEDR
jgi:iron complex transport system substrate-binding protein